MKYYKNINNHIVLTPSSPELKTNEFSELVKAMVIAEQVEVCKNCLHYGDYLHQHPCRYTKVAEADGRLDETLVEVNDISDKASSLIKRIKRDNFKNREEGTDAK